MTLLDGMIFIFHQGIIVIVIDAFYDHRDRLRRTRTLATEDLKMDNGIVDYVFHGEKGIIFHHPTNNVLLLFAINYC